MVQFTFANKERMIRDNQAYFEAMATELEQPFAGPAKTAVPDNLLAQWSGNLFGGRSRELHLSMLVVIDLLRIETAILRYKRAHGRFPQELKDLVPMYLPKLPVDPFSGAARSEYKYKLATGGP